jgi:hypothetical protein
VTGEERKREEREEGVNFIYVAYINQVELSRPSCRSCCAKMKRKTPPPMEKIPKTKYAHKYPESIEKQPCTVPETVLQFAPGPVVRNRPNVL